MEKFFEGEPFTTEEIVTGMAAGVRTGQITPRVLRQCRQPAGIGYAAVQHEGVAAQRRNRRCCWRKR